MLFKKAPPKTPGLSPGSLVYTGTNDAKASLFELIEYDTTGSNQTSNLNISQVIEKAKQSTKAVKWINLVGLNDIDSIKILGDFLELDSLILEDILNINQRPKIEFSEKHIYAVLRMYFYNKEKDIHSEQVSIVIKDNILVTFQEDSEDIFDPIRNRIKNPENILIKQRETDYLLYAILDVIVDHYLIVLDRESENIDRIEQELNSPEVNKKTAIEIYSMRQKTSIFRKKVIPVRELVNSIQKSDSKKIKKETHKFFNDLYDHAIVVNETLESQREALSDHLALYHTHMNNRMNETMKVLTVIATIFIPLSFLVGLYGMNFNYMPELSWRYGYHMVWAIIILVSGSMVVYFKRRGWI